MSVCPMFRMWSLFLLLTGIQCVCGIDIYTPGEVEAVNGTNVKLKCTFSSSHPVTPQSAIVTWNFRPINSGTDESVFYYQEVPYPPQSGRFKGHAVWSGDITNRDASITLHEVPPTFNGTYICQVRNRPDVHGVNGEINLKVVNKVSLSEISVLALIVGISCGVILILLGCVVAARLYKKKCAGNNVELGSREQDWNDPTVW